MRILGLLAGLLFINVSCTLSDSSATKVSIDLSKHQKAGALGTKVIRFAAVNIHHPDSPTPIPRTKDFNENDYPNGAQSEDLVFEIEDLKPTDSENVLIQVLTMSKDSTEGTMIFDYGDVSIRLKAGSNNASISLAEFTSANSSGVVAGRYMLSTNDGPSGTLIGSFNPPGNKPAMDVVKEEIFNGWFKAFMLPPGVGKFTWRLKETGQVLFDNIDTSSFSPSGHLMKVAKAKSYRLRESVPEAAQDLFFGFFKHPSNTLDITSKKVCYLANNQAVPMHYTSAPGAAVPVPLIYDNTSDVIGGQSKNHEQLYANNECDIETDEYMSFHPSLLAERDGEALGMRGPFANMNPLIGENGYTRSDYESTNTQITLKWQYLQGITDASVNGVAIYGSSTNGGGGSGGGDDLPCDKRAEQKGLDHLGDVLRINAPNNEFNQGSISAAESHSWRFMICPYKDLPTGERHYYNASIENHCRGNCQDLQNFGIGANNAIVTGGNFTGAMGGASARINSTVLASPDYTSLNTQGAAYGTFTSGSEILLMVVGESNNGCDASGQYDPGHFESTTALAVSGSGSYVIKIPKGTFIENIPSTELATVPVVGTPACYIQAVQVPHIKDLNLSGTLITDGIDYSDPRGGGVIAFRVSGTLDITAAANIDVTGKGFMGGTPSHANGASHNSERGTAVGRSGGERHTMTGTANGAGGGSIGKGLNGGTSNGGGSTVPYSSGNLVQSIFGAGGGSASASGTTQTGGGGGGVVLIFAKKIKVTNSLDVLVNGDNGLSNSGTGTANGGGGGGGALNLFADNIEVPSAMTLGLQAKGGDSGGGTGGGGGGAIHFGACDITGTGTISPYDVKAGDGQTGSANVGIIEDSPNLHFCD